MLNVTQMLNKLYEKIKWKTTSFSLSFLSDVLFYQTGTPFIIKRYPYRYPSATPFERESPCTKRSFIINKNHTWSIQRKRDRPMCAFVRRLRSTCPHTFSPPYENRRTSNVNRCINQNQKLFC